MIALCPNPFRDIDLETTKEAAELLGKEGFETVICPVFAEQGDACLPQNIKYERVIDAARKCSLAVVIGGDGTILAVARKIHDYEVPLIGINLGTKGFMAHLEKAFIKLANKIIMSCTGCLLRYGLRFFVGIFPDLLTILL